jgi:hypothetical protein
MAAWVPASFLCMAVIQVLVLPSGAEEKRIVGGIFRW